jgi:hypothetical protein
MNALLDLRTIPPNRLYRLNLCRIFLQVECISEICNIAGTEILQEIWKGIRPHSSQTTILWPNQSRPHEQSWNERRTVLKDALLVPNIIRANKAQSSLPLRQHLGPWIGTRHRTQRQWMHYMVRDGNTLYVKRPRGFHCHKRIPTLFSSHRYQVEKSSIIQNLNNVKIATPIECSIDRRSLSTSPNPAVSHDPTATDELTIPDYTPAPNTTTCSMASTTIRASSGTTQ